MAYATTSEVEAGFRTLTEDETTLAAALLDEAAIIIDAYSANADEAVKGLVSCRMVRRSIGDGSSVPMGATQGTMSALGYSQSWTMGQGTTGELYLSRLEKKLLGAGNNIGYASQLESMVDSND